MSNVNMISKKGSAKGFTLIEIMITVAILGIIASIAVPSYVEYVRKGKRADAKVELLRLAQMQESFFVQNLSYAKNLTASKATGGLGLGTTVLSEQGEYSLAISDKEPSGCNGLSSGTPCTGYTITATPVSGKSQANDSDCKGFTINNVGQKGITVASATTAMIQKCWK